MNKLIATIKYGSAKTKAFLALVFVLLAGGIALGIYGGITFTLWALTLGGIMAITGLVMVFMANFSTQTVDVDEDEDDERRGRRNEGRKDRRGSLEYEDNASERKRKTKSGDTEIEYTVNEFDEVDFGVIDGVLPKNRDKYKKQQSEEAYEDDEFATLEGEAPRKRRSAEEEERPQFTAEEKAERYTPEVFRRALHQYKVKKDYIPIIIDECASFGTAKTPSLCWHKRDKVFFLLMEGNERVVEMPMKQFLNVTYRQNVPEKDIPDYDAIRRKMGVYEEFEDVMPTFNSQGDRMGRTQYMKNQYVLGRDVAITPRSLRSLMGKYKFQMKIYESLGLNNDASIYFKKAYETRILWTDNVIGQQEYQNRIRNILENMAEDDSIDRLDFMDEVDNMVRFRLITDEYAGYYNVLRSRRESQGRRR